MCKPEIAWICAVDVEIGQRGLVRCINGVSAMDISNTNTSCMSHWSVIHHVFYVQL